MHTTDHIVSDKLLHNFAERAAHTTGRTGSFTKILRTCAKPTI